MADGCCPSHREDSAERRTCPRSGTPGAPVELTTVKANLTVQALQRISRSPHRFCPDPRCDVVYFDTDHRIFTVDDVRVPVWQKELSGARMVCYCFGENEADMQREVVVRGSCGAVERVRAHIVAGRCACELRNPRGACCLGDVIAAVMRIESAALRPEM